MRERIEKISEALREKGVGVLLILIGLLVAALGGWIAFGPLSSGQYAKSVGGVIMVLGSWPLLDGSLRLVKGGKL